VHRYQGSVLLYVKCGTTTIIVVTISRIVVVTIVCWIVVAIVVVIATPIHPVVGTVGLLVYP